MPTVHGQRVGIYIDDQNAVCQNMKADLNSITFTRTKSNPEATTFADTIVQRLDGLRDGTMDCTGVFRTGVGTSGVAGLLDTMWSNSLVSRVQYSPASLSGSPVYTGCMVLNSYAINSPLDGVVTVNFAMAIAAGSITAACIA